MSNKTDMKFLYERHQDYLYQIAKEDNEVYNWLRYQVWRLCEWVEERPNDIREIVKHEKEVRHE